MNLVMGICQIFTRVGETLFNLYKNPMQNIMVNLKISTVVISYLVHKINFFDVFSAAINMHLFIYYLLFIYLNLLPIASSDVGYGPAGLIPESVAYCQQMLDMVQQA
jgi:uncharacterized membrane protein